MMTTIDATISVMRDLSENDRRKVFSYAQTLKSNKNVENPYKPLSMKQVLADLDQSEKEFAEGKGIDAHEAIQALRKQHGFI